jgi:hypothetical protein
MTLFALCPLQLRYATEARPYAQALFFSLAATVVFIKLVEQTKPSTYLTYFAVIVAGLYTQPFTIFIPAAHWFWLALPASAEYRKKALVATSFTIAAALLALVPWYIYAHSFWRASTVAGQFQFVFGWKQVSLLLRELTGAGYIGTGLLLLSCGLALAERRLTPNSRWFWGVMLILPFAALAADAYFGYFVAIRQFITVLPPLVLLSAWGIDQLASGRKPALGIILQSALVIAFLVGGYRWFTKPREDWQETAATLRRRVQRGGCAIFVPSGSRAYYEFFDPTIGELGCARGASPETIWLAVSPYEAASEYQSVVGNLESRGYKRYESRGSTRPAIESFHR